MKVLTKSLIAAVALAGSMTLIGSSASAAVVCNAAGECWHTHRSYHYDPAWGVTVHPNHWRWGATDHYTWREHAGRGYWRDGVWIRF